MFSFVLALIHKEMASLMLRIHKALASFVLASTGQMDPFEMVYFDSQAVSSYRFVLIHKAVASCMQALIEH